MRRPIHEMLDMVSGRVSLHMPGAQGRAPFERMDPSLLETTELPVTDDLYQPAGAIAQAERLLAVSANAHASFMLQGGSTAGVHAMILYACRRGDTVILPRNVHLSALNICAVAGIIPVFAEMEELPGGWFATTPDAYRKALEDSPCAKAALAVSSDYYGLLCNLPAIADIVHSRDKLLLCDEAHGAYFNWRNDVQNAGARGADLFVQSAHKTLPALNAAAWLHAMQGIDAGRLRTILRMVQTSSPSFTLMQSMDDARAWMDEYGRDACERMLQETKAFMDQASALGFTDDRGGIPADRLRVVLRAPWGGEWLRGKLQAMGIDVEMADTTHIVCIASLLDGEKRLRILLDALETIERESAAASPTSDTPNLQTFPMAAAANAAAGSRVFGSCGSVSARGDRARQRRKRRCLSARHRMADGRGGRNGRDCGNDRANAPKPLVWHTRRHPVREIRRYGMKNLPYDTVIFDLDGTLTRSEDGILTSLRYALESMGRPVPPDSELKICIGPPLRDSFMNLCGFTVEQANEAIQHYVTHYYRKGMFLYSVYPHIRTLLIMLRRHGAYVAVATSKPVIRANQLFEQYHLSRYFDRVIGEDNNDAHIGKAELIRRALPDNCRSAVMVGDRRYDIEGAKANGLDSIGVRYGYGCEGELEAAGATCIADTTLDLMNLLCPDCQRPRGYFLSMEGLDGSGKTTQINRLAKRLTALGYDVVQTREPGGCKISEDIRNLVLTTDNMEMSAACEALLYAAARAQHVHEVIRPSVNAGKLVLCDRFVDSSIAYQGGGRELGVENVGQINAFAIQEMIPDATVYLRMGCSAQALKRRRDASKPDRLESQPPAFYERTRKAYDRLMQDTPERFVVVDGDKPLDTIAEDILAAVLNRLQAAEGR